MADRPSPRRDWHLRDAHELAREHGVDPTHGLHEAEAARRALKHGPNEITGARAARGPLALLLDQFKDFMILVLLARGRGFGRDRRTGRHAGHSGDRAAQRGDRLRAGLARRPCAWRRCSSSPQPRPRCCAAGRRRWCRPAQLVPGDIVLLEAGNQVPADLRLIEIAQLQGRRIGADRRVGHGGQTHGACSRRPHRALGDRLNMAFKGTTATHGRGTRPGGGHRHGHRAGQGGRRCWTDGRRPQHAAAAAAGRLRQAAGAGGAGASAR